MHNDIITREALVKRLIEDSPHEIAKDLGLCYTGDMNPYDHDGTFYSTADWADHDYAECLRLYRGDGSLFVERGVIHRPKYLTGCFDSAGLAIDVDEDGKRIASAWRSESFPVTDEVEIECVLGHWGSGGDVDNYPGEEDDTKCRDFECDVCCDCDAEYYEDCDCNCDCEESAHECLEETVWKECVAFLINLSINAKDNSRV